MGGGTMVMPGPPSKISLPHQKRKLPEMTWNTSVSRVWVCQSGPVSGAMTLLQMPSVPLVAAARAITVTSSPRAVLPMM